MVLGQVAPHNLARAPASSARAVAQGLWNYINQWKSVFDSYDRGTDE